MTDPGLNDLLQRAADPLDPSSADRILAGSLRGGDRRRRRRHLAATATAGGVAVAVTGIALAATGGGTTRGEDPSIVATQPGSPTGTATSPADGATSYAPGSETVVPEGPEIPTDRGIVGDERLAAVVQDLLGADGEITDVEVEHVSTTLVGHMADATRRGRQVSFLLDGMSTTITIQRWDGYAAVGIAHPTATTEAELGQRVATTAAEACGGAYRSFPVIECTAVDGGAYEAGWPSQGDAMPDTHKELALGLYTDDGWFVHVDSYNTPGEKVGGSPLQELPPLDVDRSLAIAQSPRWFTAD